MIPEETKDLFRTLKRHPVPFAALYVPAIVSVVIACRIYRPYPGFLFPLLWCFLVGLFLIKGITDGQMTDNHGTAIRCSMPVRFWGKVAIWSFAYIFAMAWAIGFALQETNRMRTEPSGGAYGSPAAGSPSAHP
jgi:hypothetical protein